MIFFLFIFFSTTISYANWNTAYELEASGIYENLSEDRFGERYSHADFLTRIESRIRYNKSLFNFSADTQLRGIYSSKFSTLQEQENFYDSSVGDPQRGLKLETDKYGDSDQEFQGSFERLTFGLKSKSWEVLLGRQPFSLGVMKIVPVWNRFVSNLHFSGQYFQFPNQDGGAFRYQNNVWSVQFFSIIFQDHSRNAQLVENTLTWDSSEFRALFGVWEENLTYGLGFSTPCLDGQIRGEYLKTGLRENDKILMDQFAFGFETAFSDVWSMNLETLYLSTGENNSARYDVTELNSFRPLLAQHYAVIQLKYDSQTFFYIEPQVIINAVDGSAILGGDFVYSLSDSSELTFRALFPTGTKGQEFSSVVDFENPVAPFGMSQQALVKLKLFF